MKKRYMIALIFCLAILGFSKVSAEAAIVIEGEGSSDSPYLITKEEQLVALAKGQLPDDAFYSLENNIKLTASQWKPIDFSGVFLGKGHVISNVKITSNTYENNGLFGWNSGCIYDLGVENVEISVNGRAGGLTGYNSGTIDNCYSTGIIESKENDVGGLIGKKNRGAVSNSYSLGKVKGNAEYGYAGGLIGYLKWGYISFCYAAGQVEITGDDIRKGGLIGGEFHTEDNIFSSYYSEDTSGCKDAGKGISLSSSEIKNDLFYTVWDKEVWNLNHREKSGFPSLICFNKTDQDKNTTDPSIESESSSKKVNLEEVSVGTVKNQVYTGKEVKPKIHVEWKGKELKSEVDYVVVYQNNVRTGKATITLHGKGKYTGKQEKYFYIVPKRVRIKASSPKAKAIKIEWKKDKLATGYEFQYAEEPTFKNTGKIISVEKKNVESLNLAKLKPGKIYHLRARAYIKVEGKKYKGNYSKTISIKVK